MGARDYGFEYEHEDIGVEPTRQALKVSPDRQQPLSVRIGRGFRHDTAALLRGDMHSSA